MSDRNSTQSVKMEDKVVLVYMSVNPWMTPDQIENRVKEFYQANEKDFPVGKIYVMNNIKKSNRMIWLIGQMFKIGKHFKAGWG